VKAKNLNSPMLLLSTVYPEYEWLPWKFVRSQNQFWNDPKNQRKFMDWAGKQLQIKEMSDWYKVTQKVKINYCKFLLFLGYFRSKTNC
jgi:hypothetical protein